MHKPLHHPTETIAMTVITRFAPSPTGYLHIGGARTALFNWLYARHMGGQFLLRIEDTDKERSTPEATQAIIDGMQWLGLEHDGEIIYQSARADRHAEVARELLAKGKAYQCYCTPEELDTMREQAKASGLPIRSPWRNKAASDASAGAPFVVRIKAPLEGEVVIDDAVQGTVRVAAQQLDDFIILRSDGSPTYMHAVVVDDHDMGITHVIRGDDHLNNAFRQWVIYDAMGWNVPTFAHIPLIHGPDGAKLSKRHGALGVEAYRDMGYLPEAIRNYLLRLGWSHGNEEIISTEQAIEWFDITAINKGASRMDFDKLANLNGHYIRACENAHLEALTITELNKHLERPLELDEVKRLERAMESLKQRAKTIVELAESAVFYFRHLHAQDDKAKQQLNEGLELMKGFIPHLETAEQWTHDGLFALAKTYAESAGVKIGVLMAPIRVAITGSTGAPSMFEVMEILGSEESLKRLKSF